MNVLVTGSEGFLGKNLIERLSRVGSINIFRFHRDTSLDRLDSIIKNIDFIFHLAGVNRPQDNNEFYSGNSSLTYKIIELIEIHNKSIPILFSSSSQTSIDNDYGKSKLEAENHLKQYSERSNSPIFIYRLPGVFGKWSKPYYNSVISTWCYNIANDLEIQINNEDKQLELVYIDDVINSFISKLNLKISNYNCKVEKSYSETLGNIAELLYSFKDSRKTLIIPKVGSGFERALYATYLSYLPTDKFSYTLSGHSDNRGTFYEILKTLDSGQFSISTTKPGEIIRGNHYHNTKNEKFLVVKGEAIIQLRQINSNDIVEYNVSDKKMQVVEMIPGYTHNIKNISNEEMILLIWANEIYNPLEPDTYFLEV